MTVYRDAQLTMSAAQSDNATAATLDRRMPYTGDLEIEWQPNDQQSEQVESGAIASVSASYRPTESVTGTYNTEMKGKGMGRLLKGGFGAGATTLVSTGLYQENFYPGTGPLFDCHTWQAVRKLLDGTDAVSTFIGMCVNSMEFSMDNAGVLKLAVEFIGRTIDKVGAISKASVSAVSANRFTFAGFSAYTGTLTEPTGTTLGSAVTALTDLRTFSIKIENNLTDDDFRSDGSGLMAQPTVLRRTITGQFEARNTAAIQAFRTTWIANGTTPLVVNFTAGTADAVQFVLPAIRLTNPPTPNADGNQPRVTNQFEVLSNGTSTQPMWCVVRTDDTAL
ncbi:MAG: hypothetical protein CVT65_03845 [Actinobacteria bacterium HGW-Actinobacteria-5]|jgi:hypothetical protein|nr:MAG: hypothetical protein CVT65_03845 [Actinobacteria bacterium HGW-Actinobacteria-5]